MTLPIHPVCYDFPPLSPDQRTELAKSIQEHGCKVPVVLWNGQIIDGRNRAEICEDRGIEPPTKVFEGTEAQAIEHAWILNGPRRHMTPSQRALAGERLFHRLKTLAEQGTDVAPRGAGKTAAAAAQRVGSSTRSVERAIAIRQRGTPKLQEAVESGAVTVNDAARILTRPAAEQNQAVVAIHNGKAKTVAEAVGGVIGTAGKPIFDDRIIDALFGKLLRAVDTRGEKLGKDERYNRCRTDLEAFIEHFKEWQRT